MSHVFISYSHKNLDMLASLLARLDQSQIPYWYDDDIEAGDRWRIEIDQNLQDSFVVVVIATPESMSSIYATYEWSWAIGNGAPIITLLFMSPNEIHAPLQEFQYVKCEPEIPDSVIGKLKELQIESPLSLLLGQRIGDMVSSTRILTRVALWSYHYTQTGVIDYNDFYTLVDKAKDVTIRCCRQELPDFWITRSSAFNRRQTRLYAQLITRMEEFWDLLNELRFQAQLYHQDHTEQVTKVNDFRLQFIDPLLDRLRATWQDYRDFDTYLQDVSDYNLTQGILRERKHFHSAFVTTALAKLSNENSDYVQRVIEKVEKAHPGE